jgi:hypothetical protein
MRSDAIGIRLGPNMGKILLGILTAILVAALGIVFSENNQPDLEVSCEWTSVEIPIILFMLKSHEEKPITITRININGEYDLPLKSQVSLKTGEIFTQYYNYTEGPRIEHVTVATDRGIYNQDLHGTWPGLASVFDMARKVTLASHPVPPPTPPPRPTSSPESVSASPTNSAQFGSLQPSSSEPVSSSNPVLHFGSYINRTTGEQGDLTLRVEHFIDTEDGLIAFGGKLTLGQSTSGVAGSYSPTTQQITFSQGTQSPYQWSGTVTGDAINGTFFSRSSSNQEGLWQAKHTGGLSFSQAGKAYGASNPSSKNPNPITRTPPSICGEYIGQTVNDTTQKIHQIKLTLETNGTGSTNLVATLTDLQNSNSFSGIGEVVYGIEPIISLNFEDQMHLDGKINIGSVFQGKWWGYLKASNQYFSGTFKFQKTNDHENK